MVTSSVRFSVYVAVLIFVNAFASSFDICSGPSESGNKFWRKIPGTQDIGCAGSPLIIYCCANEPYKVLWSKRRKDGEWQEIDANNEKVSLQGHKLTIAMPTVEGSGSEYRCQIDGNTEVYSVRTVHILDCGETCEPARFIEPLSNVTLVPTAKDRKVVLEARIFTNCLDIDGNVAWYRRPRNGGFPDNIQQVQLLSGHKVLNSVEDGVIWTRVVLENITNADYEFEYICATVQGNRIFRLETRLMLASAAVSDQHRGVDILLFVVVPAGILILVSILVIAIVVYFRSKSNGNSQEVEANNPGDNVTSHKALL